MYYILTTLRQYVIMINGATGPDQNDIYIRPYMVTEKEETAKSLCKDLNKAQAVGVNFCDNWIDVDEIKNDDYEYYSYQEVGVVIEDK